MRNGENAQVTAHMWNRARLRSRHSLGLGRELGLQLLPKAGRSERAQSDSSWASAEGQAITQSDNSVRPRGHRPVQLSTQAGRSVFP